jgi:hypothetical protein
LVSHLSVISVTKHIAKNKVLRNCIKAQELFILVPHLFDKECQRRREFCDENKIDYKVPSFKSSDYTPGLEMVNTHESSSEDEEEVSESDNAKAIAVSVQFFEW